MIKIKDIKQIIQTLEKIKMPCSPKTRYKIFSIIKELKREDELQEELKKSYITSEVIRVEAEKQELIRSLHSENGKITIGEYKLNDIQPIEEYVNEHNKHPDFVALRKYYEYISEDYCLESELINIDETDDEMFLNLSDEEISHIMYIIK